MRTDGNRSLNADMQVLLYKHRLMGLLNTVLRLTKEKCTVLLDILTDHGKLNKHLYQKGIVNDPTCICCEKEDEKMEHVLCHCPPLVGLRGALLGEHWPNMTTVAGAPAGSLIQFTLNTG